MTEMTREEFDKWLDSEPEEAQDPFCPFGLGGGYCNDAYTERCWGCVWIEKDFYNE